MGERDTWGRSSSRGLDLIEDFEKIFDHSKEEGLLEILVSPIRFAPERENEEGEERKGEGRLGEA